MSYTIHSPGLSAIQQSAYSIKQYGVSLAPPPAKPDKIPRDIYASPVMYPNVSNDINNQIAYDNTVLTQKESYESSGYTPMYSGKQNMSYNSTGKLHKEVFTDGRSYHVRYVRSTFS